MDYENINSDAWLVEKIFSQLKEFNPDNQDELIEQVDKGGENSSTENFNKTECDNQVASEDIKFEDARKLDEPIDLSTQDASNIGINLQSETSTYTDQSNANYNLNSNQQHDQRYLDLLLASLPSEYYSDDIIIVKESPNKEEFDIKCTNCDQTFEEDEFNKHVCDYDENKNLIRDEEPIKYVTVEISEPPCIRQLRENNARIRKFLKDELKIDIGGSTKKQDGPHECMMCERKFVHASGLTRHMEKHALDLIPMSTNTSQAQSGLRVVLKCLACGRIFFSHLNAIKHLVEDHRTEEESEDMQEIKVEVTQRKLQDYIDFVRKEFTPPDNYKYNNSYLKMVILSSVLQCEFCDFVFSEASNVLLHASSHNPQQGYECSSCGINVHTFKEIFLHWQAECPYSRDEFKKNNLHIQRYFVCNVCENKFTSYEQLYEHRYTAYHLFPRVNLNLGILQTFCEYCGTIHERAQLTVRHYEEKHRKKIKKETTSKYRQYLCDVCGKSYTQSSHLWQHLRFHRGVKPFACKEPGCNRRFTIRPDLNDHIRKCHTGERPYHCLVCGKRFLTGSVFYQHRLIHRGERRYGCDECGKRFYRADALKNHQRIHTGEKPYGCMYCNKSFRQRGDRDKHIRARHSNLEANLRSLSLKSRNQQPKDGVVYVGNVAFPSSMFTPMVRDIDECQNTC